MSRLQFLTPPPGILATPTTRTLPTSNPIAPEEEADDDEEEEEEEPTKILEQTSTFDEFVVWSHERVPVSSEDPFMKGVEEWVRFAEVVSWRFSRSVSFSFLLSFLLIPPEFRVEMYMLTGDMGEDAFEPGRVDINVEE